MKNNSESQTFVSLRRFNIAAAVLHFVQGCLMVWLSSDFSLPVTSYFLQFNAIQQRLVQDLQVVVNIRLGFLIASFLFLSALAHLIISLPGIFEWYTHNLRKGINYARWVEYAFSSSVMIVAIAMLVGIYDVVSLLLIFGVNAMMILFGWVMEVHNQTTERTNWTAFIFGSLAGIFPWIAITIYLVGSGGSNGEVPTFVYWIFFSLFLFFNIFAVNMVLQYKKVGKWRDYIFGEYGYIILSLVAKSLLAWQVWAGTLRP